MSRRSRIIVAFIACAVLILGVVGIACMLHQPNTNPAESDSEITVFTEPVSNIPEAEITEPENPDETEPSSEESTSVDEDSEWTTPIESDADGEESKSPDTLEETETADPETEESNTGEPDTTEPDTTETDTTEPETDVSEPSRDSCLDGGEHSYTLHTVQATCTTEGKTVHICSECGYTYSSALVLSLGHKWSDWIVTTEPSCSAGGVMERTCAACSSVESKKIEQYSHQYEFVMAEDTSTDGSKAVYRCELCNDTYELEEGESLPEEISESYVIPSCDKDFSFYIMSEGDPEYIYQNLSITDAYKSAQAETASLMRGNVVVDVGDVRFTVTPVQGVPNKWLVTVEGGYSEYCTYVVIPNGDISFADYNTESLVICVDGADRSDIQYNLDNLLFLKVMEDASPGYYPYSVKFDENAEKYYVTVSKKGDFDQSCIGKVLCVGELSSTDDFVVESVGELYFGKITSIWSDEKGLTVIELVQPELGDVYDCIQYCGSGDVNFTIVEEQIADQLQEEFVQSDTFARFIGAANLAVTEYTRANGLDVHTMSNESIWDNLKFEKDIDETEQGIVAYITAKLPIDIKNKGTKIGSVNVECTVTLTVDFEVRHNIVTKKWNGLIVGFSQFGINIVNTNTVAFDASCKFELEYQNETPDFCVHPKTGIIHSSDCRYIVNSSIMTIYEKYSTQQLLHTYNVDSVKKLASKECTVCKPISGLEGGLFIVNASTKKVHCADCVHVAKIDKAEYWVILPFAGEYSYCTDCMPDKAQHKEFNECFKNSINSEDLTEVMKKVKEYTAGLARGEKKSPGRRLATLRFDAPIVSLLVDIDFVLDLDLEISLDLHMEKTFVNDVYVRLVGNKIECGSNPDKDNKGTLKDSVDAMGSMEFKVGIRLGARVTFNGPFEKWCYIGISVEGGVYVDIRGIFHATRTDGELNDDYYYAAYFECGIYLNAYFDYALFVFEDSIPLGDKKFPIWVGGNDRIYYQYSDYDKTVDITRDATSLSSLDLLQVDYMLLNEAFTKKSGMLSPSGVRNQYTVSYAFKNEDGSANTYCVVENGTLKIKDGAPEDFTVIMIVTVSSKKAATFQDFLSMSYTEGNRKPIFFLEPYEITLVVDRDHVTGGGEDTGGDDNDDPDPGPSTSLSFVSNGDGTCYVSGIGSCTDLSVVIPSVSPDGERVTSIGDSAFEYCESLTSITIPDSVTSIGDSAFYWCESLTSITIPDSVTSIGDFAFENCDSLTSITIPDSVTSIGYSVFASCDSLTSIAVEEGNPTYRSVGNCLIHTESKTLLVGCCNSVIPTDGSVTSIGDSAFYLCESLTSITLPDSVTSIGDFAFAYCYSLTSITIPDGVTSIEVYAFSRCYSLTSITIPDSVTSIGDYAFYCCESLTSITIPDSVTSIGDSAFAYCGSLTSITLPDSVTSIGDSAFERCDSLTSITIPDSVTSIGDSAFAWCFDLTDVYYSGTIDQWRSIAIGSYNDYLFASTIHCADGDILPQS